MELFEGPFDDQFDEAVDGRINSMEPFDGTFRWNIRWSDGVGNNH